MGGFGLTLPLGRVASVAMDANSHAPGMPSAGLERVGVVS